VELNRDAAALALPALHERDLEGHLSAQGSRASGAGSAGGSPIYREPPGAIAPSKTSESGVDGRDAHDVPRDPLTGSDFALRIAYQAVRGTLPPPALPR
jgi:hypothetical protein